MDVREKVRGVRLRGEEGMDEYRNKIIQGHALDVLKGLPDQLVDCVITSPPYWSLRDYKTEPVVWDGISLFSTSDEGEKQEKSADGCDHEWGEYQVKAEGYTGARRWQHVGGREGCEDGTFSKEVKTGAFCSACNAWRGQLGLEPTIELYLNHLLQIFDEVRRVMKDEGTLWVNLGDSYSASGGSGSEKYSKRHTQFGKVIDQGTRVLPRNVKGLPAKSLCLIPQRFAIAMVDRGWILRNTLIWHKPSCMPSSAKDRFTVDFEYVYFFVKQQKYWFEQQFDEATTGFDLESGTGRERYDGDKGTVPSGGVRTYPQGRNRRCVWTVNTQPFPEAHFATFPEKLVEPMILAGCPEGGITLDPFIGAGTVAIVAAQNRRDYLGIDLSDEYNEMSDKRIFDPKNTQIKLL